MMWTISKFPSTHFYKLPFKLYKQLVDKAFFYVDEEIYKLFFEKISENMKYLNSFVNSNVGFIAKAGLITSKKENDNQERVIKGDCFFRYLLTKAWWFEFKKQNLAGGTQDETKLRAKEKIFLRKTGSDIIATFDDTGILPEQSIYFLYKKEELNYDLKEILGIINSRLINLYYRSFAVTNRDTIPQLKKIHLDEFPIKLGSKKISKFVTKIINLKKSHHALFENWNEWSIKLKNDELSLHQVLVNDANLMRKGEFEKAWTLEATFYPNGEHENLSKEYKKFRVVGDNEKPILKIYGLDENNKEETIYEMEFKNRDLMLHVFLSIKQALESKRKIKTLAHLLAKTVVPIIQPDSEMNTLNIMRKVREEFGKWVESEKIEHVELDIVKIENEIEDVDARIDALVFRLYGLDEDEVRTVLDSLKVLRSYEEAVLKHYKEKNEQ